MTCNTKLILCAAVLPAISSLAIGGRRLRKNIKTMESGKLFRYNVASKEESQVSLVEKEFSDFTGYKFAVGLNSFGSAIFLMLKCAGAQHGDKVLTNGFTFTAVPSAIVHAGCDPVYVDDAGVRGRRRRPREEDGREPRLQVLHRLAHARQVGEHGRDQEVVRRQGRRVTGRLCS